MVSEPTRLIQNVFQLSTFILYFLFLCNIKLWVSETVTLNVDFTYTNAIFADFCSLSKTCTLNVEDRWVSECISMYVLDEEMGF